MTTSPSCVSIRRRSARLRLPLERKHTCYRNASARVVAFVHLYQSSENKLTKLRGRDSFDSIYSSSAFLHSDKVRHLATFDTVADVLERVPVYRLDCRPDEAAVRLTEALLAQSAS